MIQVNPRRYRTRSMRQSRGNSFWSVSENHTNTTWQASHTETHYAGKGFRLVRTK